MNKLFFMVTITEREFSDKFSDFYKKHNLEIFNATVGYGTAANEVLNFFGLDSSEKVVFFHVVTDATWKMVKKSLQKEMHIEYPRMGVAFIIPMSSMGGKKALSYLTCGQEFVKGEETTLKETKYELLVVIANQGYSELIMDAARSENAGGGTVVHAKGTGTYKAEQFLGVTLVPEKEMLFIVAKTTQKAAIMRAIMDKAGLNSPAKSIVFSLPVTDTAGMRLLEEIEEE